MAEGKRVCGKGDKTCRLPHARMGRTSGAMMSIADRSPALKGTYILVRVRKSTVKKRNKQDVRLMG